MYQQGTPEPQAQSPFGVRLDARRLWAGGVATAVVAALIGVVGILIIRGVLDIHVLAPASRGTWESTSALEYAGSAFVGGLVATGLMHLLLVTTPRALALLRLDHVPGRGHRRRLAVHDRRRPGRQDRNLRAQRDRRRRDLVARRRKRAAFDDSI
jgi:hypothetical protein